MNLFHLEFIRFQVILNKLNFHQDSKAIAFGVTKFPKTLEVAPSN